MIIQITLAIKYSYSFEWVFFKYLFIRMDPFELNMIRVRAQCSVICEGIFV